MRILIPLCALVVILAGAAAVSLRGTRAPGTSGWLARAAPSARLAVPQYAADMLPTAGEDQAAAAAINERGDVVGSDVGGSGYRRPFFYSGGRLVDLASRFGWEAGVALGLNNTGTVVGLVHDPLSEPPSQTAFFLPAGGPPSLLRALSGPGAGTAPRWQVPIARGVNDRDEVVGDIKRAARDWQTEACCWSEGVPTPLGTLGGQTSSAFALNDAGWVVGRAHTERGDLHAFLFRNGVMEDLGTFGGEESCARAINALGWVAGRATRADHSDCAFLYRDGRMRELALPPVADASEALGINRSGQVVGESNLLAIHCTHATLWSGGAVYDLNDCCATGGWVLTSAAGINDRGQIAATGNRGSASRAFLLTPVR